MYDFLHKNKRLAQVILALIALPFAFFGVDYYFRGASSEGEVARVGGEPVSKMEFDQVLRDQQARMRQALGGSFDPAVFDDPQVRSRLLDEIISQRLLVQRARDQNIRVSNQQLEQAILGHPAFQQDGQFSFERYQEAVRGQGLTQAGFEARLRQDLALRVLDDPFSGASIVSHAYVRHILELAEEQREVQVFEVSPQPFLAQVSVDDAQVKAFYDANQASFQVPEQVKAEYLLVGIDAITAGTRVDPQEVRQLYEQNAKQFARAEERQASHILVGAPADATAERKAAAKKRAEELVAEARRAPERFAELARQHSDDPGSKEQGGDLGFFARGSMPKPFEDAVFGMAADEIAGPVETDFGYHVIRLAAIKGAGARPFDEVKAQLEQDLRRQKASKTFAEIAEQFQNLVYEQADSLAGVEKTLIDKGAAVKIERTDWITREQAQALAQNSARFAQALFSPESIQAKRNTEAIEVAPNTLIAGRVLEHKPASPRPFDEVKAEIASRLQAQGAARLAQKAGEERLAQLRQGRPVNVEFGAPQNITRARRPDGLAEDVLKQVFAAPTGKLPSYVGGATPKGGYVLVRISRAIPANPDAQKIDATMARVAEQLGREQLGAYLASLRKSGDVVVDAARIAGK
jgi:peptidyl-prolyl cis-trans isomerase D